MQINLVSSLTPDDELRFAAASIEVLGTMLELLPVAYSIRIQTASGKLLDRTHSPLPAAGVPAVLASCEPQPSARLGAAERPASPALCSPLDMAPHS